MHLKITKILSELPYLLLTIITVLAVVFIRINLLETPLERDEGEYAYMGQLLLEGFPPYLHAYTMKLPGTSMIYAVFMSFFGETVSGIHLGLLIINIISIILVWAIAKDIFDLKIAYASAITYALLSLSQNVLGLFAHATNFAAVFGLSGILLILKYISNERRLYLLVSGICFGLAIMMKQHAIFLEIFAVYYLLHKYFSERLRKFKTFICILLVGIGTMLPIMITVTWMALSGTFSSFWTWVVIYSKDYLNESNLLLGTIRLTFFISECLLNQPLIWIFAFLGLLLLHARQKHEINSKFIFWFLIASLLTTCPGLYFRPHYFVTVIPPVAILAGFFICRCNLLFDKKFNLVSSNNFSIILLAFFIIFSLYSERNNYFIYSNDQLVKKIYGKNPFVESKIISEYIKKNTSPKDLVAIIGSEPQILFYSKRISSTGYIYTYGLKEINKNSKRMQEEMINEIESRPPILIIEINNINSWGYENFPPALLKSWLNKFLAKDYELVAVMNVDPQEISQLQTNSTKLIITQPDNFINIWRKR